VAGNARRYPFVPIATEQSKREIIAQNLGISARNNYAMLERIGGECAGAVTLPAFAEVAEDHKDRTSKAVSSTVLPDTLARWVRFVIFASTT
jgi:HipA N-terminal domain